MWKCQKAVKNYWVICSNVVLIRNCWHCRSRQRLRRFAPGVPKYLKSPSPCQVILAAPSCARRSVWVEPGASLPKMI